MHKKPRALFVCLFAFLHLPSLSATSAEKDALPSCIDPNGNPVAWWVAIKPPDTLNDYFYRDANSVNCAASSEDPCWGDMKHDMSDLSHGALSLTVQQIYKPGPNKLAFIMYNDDSSFSAASEDHSEYAHAKGVVASDINGGFWLVHSVPRFPKDEVGLEAYSGLTSNARINAQSFLCISLAKDQIKTIGEQLRLAHPFIYQRRGFEGKLVHDLGDEVSPQSGHQSDAKIFWSTDGRQFLSLSKSKYWAKDFYDDLVAPALNAHLFVNSWNNGQGTLPTFCSNTSCRSVRFPNRRSVCLPSCAENPADCNFDFDVANVTKIKVERSMGWPNRKDHSKWAVTVPSSPTHAVCIGDINRQNGQRVRGGGAVCLEDESLWKAFSSMVEQADTCPAK